MHIAFVITAHGVPEAFVNGVRVVGLDQAGTIDTVVEMATTPDYAGTWSSVILGGADPEDVSFDGYVASFQLYAGTALNHSAVIGLYYGDFSV
jgi:hypothetical protein